MTRGTGDPSRTWLFTSTRDEKSGRANFSNLSRVSLHPIVYLGRVSATRTISATGVSPDQRTHIPRAMSSPVASTKLLRINHC